MCEVEQCTSTCIYQTFCGVRMCSVCVQDVKARRQREGDGSNEVSQ